MKDDFLNRKEFPSTVNIFKLFFEGEELIENLMSSMDNPLNTEIFNEDLGEPDDSEVYLGTEWRITRLMWDTELGPIFRILIQKVNPENYKFTTNMSDENYDNPFFPHNHREVYEDIEHEIVEPMSYQEQLDIAVYEEDFLEAARLRDWNDGLLELLLELRPKIIEAIDKGDLISLDKWHRKLNIYRNKL